MGKQIQPSTGTKILSTLCILLLSMTGTDTKSLQEETPPKVNLCEDTKTLQEETQAAVNKCEDCQETRCSPGWIYYRGSCYYYSTGKLTWSDAKNYCEGLKSHLVVITSQEEQDKIIKLIQYFGDAPWIGLTEVDGEWKWVDGASYDSSPKFWGKGQPDNWQGHGLGGGEDCAHIRKDNNWNDDHCLRPNEFICEKPSL